MGSSGSVEWTNAMFRWVSDHPLPLSLHPSYWPFCPKVSFSCITALMICLMLHPSTLVYLALNGSLPRTCFVPIVRAIWNCIDAFFQSVRSYGSNGYLCTWSSFEFCISPTCPFPHCQIIKYLFFMLNISKFYDTVCAILWVHYLFLALLGYNASSMDLRSFTWQTWLVPLIMLSHNH